MVQLKGSTKTLVLGSLPYWLCHTSIYQWYRTAKNDIYVYISPIFKKIVLALLHLPAHTHVCTNTHFNSQWNLMNMEIVVRTHSCAISPHIAVSWERQEDLLMHPHHILWSMSVLFTQLKTQDTPPRRPRDPLFPYLCTLHMQIAPKGVFHLVS